MESDSKQIFFKRKGRFLHFTHFLVILFLFSTQVLFAQEKTLKGTVIGVDNVALPGVSISVKGTVIGTITDIDGKFDLKVPADASTLVFSFIGMKPLEVEIGTRTSFNVTLQENVVGLDEVVVVGYGTQKKESVVGAISQIDNKALIRSGVTNVTNAIAGKLAGVLTVQQSGPARFQ